MKKATIILLAIAGVIFIGCDSKSSSTAPGQGSAAEFDGKALPKLISQADIDAIIKNNKKIEASFNKFEQENPEVATPKDPQKIKPIDVKQIVKAIRTAPTTPKYNELLKQSGMTSSEPLLAYLLIIQNYTLLQHSKIEAYLGMMPKEQQANMQIVIQMQKDFNAITHKDDFELVKKNAANFTKVFQ